MADGELTSSACFLPSYNTRSTLTFSRFPVSVLILPRLLCRRARAPRDSTRDEAVGLAAVEKEEVRAGRARRQIERVSNTILTDVNWLLLEGLAAETVVLLVVSCWLLVVLAGCGVGRLAASRGRQSTRLRNVTIAPQRAASDDGNCGSATAVTARWICRI